MRHPKARAGLQPLLSLVPWLALTGLAVGQQQIEALRKEHLPQHPGAIAGVLHEDVDGDGVRELIVIGQISRVYRRVSADTYAEMPGALPHPGSPRHAAVAAGDLDGDGDLDLVIARRSWFNYVYLNDGRGHFSDVSTQALPLTVDDSLAVAVADFDGDGDLDLVFGNSDGDRFYRNDGGARFAEDTAGLARGTGTVALAAFDADGDGDVDLLRAGNGFNPTELLLNDGRGRFMAAFGLPLALPGTSAIVCGDLEGDGDIDVVLARRGQPSSVWVNDGRGHFADASSRLPAGLVDPSAVAMADLDGDGDLDLAWATDHRTVLLRNDTASFRDISARLPRSAGQGYSVALLDADADGQVDVLIGAAELSLYLNAGGGARFVDATGTRLAAVSSQSVLADIDGDGDLDLLVGPAPGRSRAFVYVNDGLGGFHDETESRWSLPAVPPSVSSNGMVVGDVDGDGAPDIVLAHQNGQNLLFLDDGRGYFRDVTAAALPVQLDPSLAVALGDIDGDGDLDMVVGNASAQNRIYRNAGGGRFVDVTMGFLPAEKLLTNGVALSDVDLDGDVDLLTSELLGAGAEVRLYLNDGSGRFGAGRVVALPPGYDGTFAIADANGDGAPDVVVDSAMLFNDGHGGFRDVTALLPAPPGISPRFADLDGDGFVDLLSYQQAFLGDGRGRFFDAAQRFGGSVPAPWALGDVDGDGDLDLVGSWALYTNQQQQLEVPLVPRLGGRLALDVYATPGYGSRDKMAVGWLFERPSAPLDLGPLGTLFFDPAAAAALPSVTVPASSGVARSSILVPVTGVPAGADVYAQYLVLHQPTRAWRLTNAVRATLRR